MGTNTDHAPFLLLSIREDEVAADDEYAAIMRFADLDDAGLRRIVLTDQELGPIELGDWSGIVLGGGPYNVSDDQKSPTQLRVERELVGLIGATIEQDFPFLGCCYGVGTLGAAIGARIDATYSEPVGAVTVSLTDAGAEDHLFTGMPREFDAYGGHKEAVTELPRGAVPLASSTACPVQAFRVGRNAYATQFHPELDVDGLCTRIDAYSGHGYFDPETAETLKADARQRSVVSPPIILRNFVERYRRPLKHGNRS
ncbi:glutamine amidotransferase [Aldersonia kunmingensis]|uniref:glutamine amidotransferase n=1 Tax=Aldersonia kunmingensis TaxID=408066 RepID=UPI0008306E0C|nr:glutamine amidotransferase [Aldersonia kunmingensis]